jgi:hypothetical protein
MAYSWGLLLAIMIPVSWYVRSQALSLPRLGLTTKNLGRSTLEALVFAVVLVAACFSLRIGAFRSGEPVITWGSIADYGPAAKTIFFLLYGPHCLLQEFIARGVLQTSFELLLPNAHRASPIVGASTFFAIFHLQVSVEFAVLTFFISLLFGVIFARHRTLGGVTLVHAALGLASVAVGLN